MSRSPNIITCRCLSLLLVQPYNLVQLLNASASFPSLRSGEQVHSVAMKLGYASNLFINSALIDMYSKCQRLSHAHKVFDEMPDKNVVAWNSMICGYSRWHQPMIALQLFAEMISSDIHPTPFSISSTLVACSLLVASKMGTIVHCIGVKHGSFNNVVVGTALIDMYAKCFDMDHSRKVFDMMVERNVVTWSALIKGYAMHRMINEAVIAAKKMRGTGTKANFVTYSTLFGAFSIVVDLAHGMQFHSIVIREGLEIDFFISTALMVMYAKCGRREDFVRMLPTMSTTDGVWCNSIISGFSHLGSAYEVLKQFVWMRREMVPIDHYTFTTVLRAVNILSTLKEGKQVHCLVIKAGYASTICVQNGLVAMYARCGKINESKSIFFSMDEFDLVSWNSLLSGCAQHGNGSETIKLYEHMIRLGFKADGITFLCVLASCSHAGYIDKGTEYFNAMEVDDLSMEHYACMVDMYGRAGQLEAAESFVNNMPIKPGPSVYKSLLSACSIHGNMDMAMRAVACLVELYPDEPTTYVMLSNILARKGSWDTAATIRNLMFEKGMDKNPGWSLLGG